MGTRGGTNCDLPTARDAGGRPPQAQITEWRELTGALQLVTRRGLEPRTSPKTPNGGAMHCLSASRVLLLCSDYQLTLHHLTLARGGVWWDWKVRRPPPPNPHARWTSLSSPSSRGKLTRSQAMNSVGTAELQAGAQRSIVATSGSSACAVFPWHKKYDTPSRQNLARGQAESAGSSTIPANSNRTSSPEIRCCPPGVGMLLSRPACIHRYTVRGFTRNRSATS